MEDITQKFLERLKELVALGKKKKSILEIQEINDFFRDMDLSTEQMERVFEYLEANNIDVLIRMMTMMWIWMQSCRMKKM